MWRLNRRQQHSKKKQSDKYEIDYADVTRSQLWINLPSKRREPDKCNDKYQEGSVGPPDEHGATYGDKPHPDQQRS